ncbi:MAG: DNA topoisomerase IB [Pyrinomonadaceae bacterium]|nr:DNA topoisomerase IB [Pyrinomonadaceae bacterium]
MKTVVVNSSNQVLSTEKGNRAKWWTRCGSKSRNFRYLDKSSSQIVDEKQLERIKSLVIPPAWKNVRICPSAGGKIQAIGIDAAGRIQYKYNPNFSAKQQQKKFQKIIDFGSHLPQLRRITNEHIALEGLPKNRVLAVVIRLINDLYIRVGSEKSVSLYKTYGVTTLRNRHLHIKNGELTFNFVGKHHIRHRRIIVDDELAAIMTDLKSVGGSKLFNHITDDKKICPITPRDVNEYLKQITAPEFSAKDFRTWGATLLAATELAEIGTAETKTQINKNIVKAVKTVAERLGNTPSVCRSSYIHPTVIESYENGITLDEFRSRRNHKITKLEAEHQADEIALMKLLRKSA